MPEHELLQDFEGAGAVFPGGVDVAAAVEAVPGDVVAGQAAGDFLLGLQGADASPAGVVRGPYGRVEAKRGTSASRFRRSSGISLPGFCFTVVLGPGTRGTAGGPSVTARRNSRGSPG